MPPDWIYYSEYFGIWQTRKIPRRAYTMTWGLISVP